MTVRVQSNDEPVSGATVTVGAQTLETDHTGSIALQTPRGVVTVMVTKLGFVDVQQTVTIADAPVEMVIDLVPVPEHEEEVIVVATTRSGRRVEDQPTRVEVLGREEIEEKMLMTPGDIVMMLNEMGGLRVQATSPSIGAASVRVQGMQGRYTRFLSDGLPLFGQQVGGLGLLQIPPVDLGQVEVIKGVASALYGAGAMGGVVNLLSRRPVPEPAADVLVNQSTLGATDIVAFVSTPLSPAWRLSLLGGGHRQTRNDRDGDGWADLAEYTRGVFRPRLFWDAGGGRSAFLTAGVTVEDRQGGTMRGASLASIGAPYVEALDTRRYDVGGQMQMLLNQRFVLTTRGAAAWQRHDHRLGEVRERDAHDTVFGEVALRGAAGAHTWVVGAAYERDDYTPDDVPRFAYTYNVPGLFVQDDVDVASWLSISAGARVDWHSEYGTFVSPRLAALARGGAWTSRLSVGRGFFATTPLTEETEAAGLTRLELLRPLRAERGTSVSWDVTRPIGAITVTATAFASRITDSAAVERDTRYVLFNRDGATTNAGAELLVTGGRGPWVATGTYTYVRAREDGDAGRRDVALTPRHSAGFVGMWEEEDWGRVGVEWYYTGRQRLEVNPYRRVSRPYSIVGVLVEKRIDRFRVFLNAENLTNVRQTRWDSLLRPSRGVDGRWTVDAWAPVDGRAINGGFRVDF
ncbi:MAG: TonB-dependent receptor [Acidobacteria bacterium]|nr:TonB-dependent receptor [Acidobacteriota bacterium]